jgi:FAD/FMN-containing dehydrogenase
MSTNKNNSYGQIPNLNSLFIGSGGIFGIPTKANFNLQRKK